MPRQPKTYRELRQFDDRTLDEADFEYEAIYGNYRENEKRDPDKARADFYRVCLAIQQRSGRRPNL
jgi:hypothetical protein